MTTHTFWPSALITLLLAAAASGCATGKSAAPMPSTDAVETTHDHADHPAQAKPGEGGDMSMSGADHEGMAMACTMTECPMHADGVQIVVDEVEGGVAVRFTVPPDGADELATRVAWLAERHNAHHDRIRDEGEAASGGEQMARMPASHAEVEREGATSALVITPLNPADLEDLRAHMHHHGEMMQQGLCPMMATGHGDPDKAPAWKQAEFWEQPTDLWPSIPMGF